MKKDKIIIDIETLELLEESQLIKIFNNLEKLKKNMKDKRPNRLKEIEKNIELYEDRLEHYHSKTLQAIKDLKKREFNKETLKMIKDFEKEIRTSQENLHLMSSQNDKRFRMIIDLERWDQMEESVIDIFEQEIEAWISLDQTLIDFEERLAGKRNRDDIPDKEDMAVVPNPPLQRDIE